MVEQQLDARLGLNSHQPQTQTAGASRFTLTSKNRNGVDFSALKAVTKPLMTKKI
ncbi:hypothetical protein NKI36_01625 [Mesorhizobium caraganae]|uniref:Uncharacterized protein n=1 Tax=Mesorhizobium caraganae TaxID=483206 RepID=A0ABV1YSM2_9HYPH